MKKDSRLFILFLTIFLDLLGFGLIIPGLPIYAKNLTGSDAMVGIIAGIFSLAQFFATPILGSLSDKIGRRPILLITLLTNTVGYLLLALSGNIVVFIIARIISGFSSGNLSVAQAYITDNTTPEKRTQAMGMIGAAFGLGFIIGPSIGGLIEQHYSFLSIGYFASGFCLLNFILAFFFLKESNLNKNLESKIKILPISEFKTALKHPIVGKLFWINFIFISAFFLFQITAALYWHEQYQISETQRGYIFAFIGLSTALVQTLLIGKMAKKFGEKKLLYLGNIIQSIAMLSLIFIPKALFIPLEYVAMFILALGSGMINPSLLSYLTQNTPQNEQGKTLGLFQSFGSLARVAGPILGGTLYGLYYNLPFILASVLLMFNVVLALSLQKKISLIKNQTT